MTGSVLVVGAGPAGLAAAIELRRLGVQPVLVADREQVPGGVPRHCAHTGYGLRDLRRLLSGPAYARHYAAAAEAAGAKIRAGATVTGLRLAGGEPLQAVITSAAGIETVQPSAVLLATGCRERPRAARLVPGDRPAGVMTTGELQQRVYLGGQRLSGRALVAGAEHVSFSAALTLAHAGADVVALVTDQPRQQSYAAFRLGAAARWHTPVWASTAVTRVIGRQRLTGVELTELRTGTARVVECETLVFTGDWIPDHELSRLAGIEIDPRTRGPLVDTALETSCPLVFAAGNLVHPAETADVAALGGRHAARQIAAALREALQDTRRDRQPLPVIPADPLAWIAPGAVRPGTPPPRGRFVLRSRAYRRLARLEVRQGDRMLARSWARLMPGRSVALPGGWAARVDPAGGSVRVLVR